jgi:hypothetical protein
MESIKTGRDTRLRRGRHPSVRQDAVRLGRLLRRLLCRVVAALVPLFLLSFVAVPAGQAAVLPPGSDSFYTSPSNVDLASLPPGTVLRSREVTLYFDADAGDNDTGLEYSGYQLLYRTTSATGQPVVNVTTLILGEGSAPAGGRKLISFQDAEDSVDPDCAPSYQMQVGEDAPNGDSGDEDTIPEIFLPFLKRGYDLVIPDPEGPGAEFAVTGAAAHAVLDSVRAVENFTPAELHGKATPVALVGYSGGAVETAAANEMQPAYAPRLHIVGVAAGGVPVVDEENLQWLDNSLFAGYLMAAAIGIDRAYPQVGLYSLLNAQGQALAQQVSTGCGTADTAAPYGNINTYTTVPNALELPQVQQVIAENELGHAVPRAPTFYYNAVHDEVVWIKPLDALISYYCAHGARIDYYRDPDAMEHATMGSDTFAGMTEAYLLARFAGEKAPDTCGQTDNAAAGTGAIPAPTINWAWNPTYSLSQLDDG